MRTSTLCILATAGLAFASSAFAQSDTAARSGDTLVITRDGNDLAIARAEPMAQIDVTAPALRDGTPVAFSGTVSGVEGRNLLISSTRSGEVLARIHETGSPEVMFYARPISRHVGIGDQVTVFGSLKKQADGLTVRADAVYDGASGTLYFARQSDQMEASPFQSPSGHFLYGRALDKRYRVL